MTNNIQTIKIFLAHNLIFEKTSSTGCLIGEYGSLLSDPQIEVDSQ